MVGAKGTPWQHLTRVTGHFVQVFERRFVDFFGVANTSESGLVLVLMFVLIYKKVGAGSDESSFFAENYTSKVGVSRNGLLVYCAKSVVCGKICSAHFCMNGREGYPEQG